MLSNQKLFSVGSFDFSLQHLLVIAVLALSVSISALIRATPATYGLDLFEFDPYFNFRATAYIIDNGYPAYNNWIDEKTWYPFGRDISENSQVILHLITAVFYKLFGFGMSLYDFTVYFPLVIGSITSIVVFAFVRVLAGTTAGLVSALMFSISMPIFTRGLIGWFKSEPLGLFLGFIAIYLFASGIMNYKNNSSLIKLVLAGFFLALGFSAWGGILFFIIPITLFYFILPFMIRENNSLIFSIPVFSISLILFSLLFERPSEFTIGYVGVLVSFSTAYLVICEIIKKFSSESNHIRNCLAVLISIIGSIAGILSSGIVNLPGFRYLNAINPFLTSLDPLTDSVSEHQTTDMESSFIFLSVFIIFALIGIWFLFSKKTIDIKIDKRVFALIIAITAFYLSSAFVRLELFASVGVIILGSIGLSILFKKLFDSNIIIPTKLLFCGVIIILFIIPVTLPENKNWISWADFPPTIYNGGTFFITTNDDWVHAMGWLKQNTSEDAVIASWWDYGYWITTLSDRTTIVDNATLIDWQIKKMAYALITTPENSVKILGSHYSEDISEYLGEENILAWGGDITNDPACKQVFKLEASKLGVPEESCNPVTKGMDADYVIVFVAGERFAAEGGNFFFYTLDGGADESKNPWFMKISNHQFSTFLESDNMTPKPYFMENSTLGKMIPFSIWNYVDPVTDMIHEEYRPGFIPIYVKDIKYLDPDKDPFYLVYASPTFYSQIPGPTTSVLIYKINPDYQP